MLFALVVQSFAVIALISHFDVLTLLNCSNVPFSYDLRNTGAIATLISLMSVHRLYCKIFVVQVQSYIESAYNDQSASSFNNE